MSVGAVNKQTGERIPTAGMPAIDDALDLTSVNPVQNAVITAALANKQDKTDNNLETTSKTVVGAVNELKSGLTNLIKSKSYTFVESDIIENCLVTDIPRTATVIGVNCTNRVGWNLIPRIGVSGSVSSDVWVITAPNGTLSGNFTIVVGYVQL